MQEERQSCRGSHGHGQCQMQQLLARVRKQPWGAGAEPGCGGPEGRQWDTPPNWPGLSLATSHLLLSQALTVNIEERGLGGNLHFQMWKWLKQGHCITALQELSFLYFVCFFPSLFLREERILASDYPQEQVSLHVYQGGQAGAQDSSPLPSRRAALEKWLLNSREWTPNLARDDTGQPPILFNTLKSDVNSSQWIHEGSHTPFLKHF